MTNFLPFFTFTTNSTNMYSITGDQHSIHALNINLANVWHHPGSSYYDPQDPCMVCLPTFGWFLLSMSANHLCFSLFWNLFGCFDVFDFCFFCKSLGFKIKGSFRRTHLSPSWAKKKSVSWPWNLRWILRIWSNIPSCPGSIVEKTRWGNNELVRLVWCVIHCFNRCCCLKFWELVFWSLCSETGSLEMCPRSAQLVCAASDSINNYYRHLYQCWHVCSSWIFAFFGIFHLFFGVSLQFGHYPCDGILRPSVCIEIHNLPRRSNSTD